MKELYDLTNPQKSIWVTEEFYKGTSIENIAGTAMLSQEVNFDKLEEAINIFVKTNDSFRLKFIKDNGNIKQFIDDFSPFSFDTINILSDKDIKKIEEELSKTPLQVINSYLFNLKFFKFEDGHGGFVIVIHHLITDAWGAGLVISRIIDIYDALLSNTFVLENFSNPSYTEYIASEKKYLESNKFEKDKTFWNDLFKTIPETATFPTLTQTKELSCKAKRKTFKIPRETMDFVNSFCKENKISPFNFFMGVYSIYLSRVSNLDEFVIGTPILNRSNVKEKHTVGMFISVVPFKVTLNHENSFAEFVSNISADFFNIFRHQKYPYQTLLEDLRKQNPSTPNLYNVMYSYQNMRSNKQSTKTDYESKWLFNGNISDDMEIHYFDINDTGIINVAYDYKTSKYSSEDIYAIHSRVLHIINQIIENNNILLKDIEIVTPDEKNKILNEFNNTKMDYPKDKTIIQLFEEQVEKTPDNIAVVFEDQKLTYRELNEKANSLAHYLRNTGVDKNNFVGIMINRSLEMIVSIIAVLKSGGAYIPIDPTYPKDRIEYMLTNSHAKLVLTSKNSEQAINFVNKLYVDLSNTKLYSLSKSNLEIISTQDDLAYCIYTSGSTGLPKGVMLTQKNIVNFIYGMMQNFKFSDKDVIVSITTISFDIFVLESLLPLLNGLKIVIANELEQTNVNLFNSLCLKNNVNIVQTTPSRMNIFTLDRNSLDFLKNCTHLLIGGEPFPYTLLEKLKLITTARIYNMYGPTETAVWSTMKDLSLSNVINVGKPIINTQIYILDKKLKPVPFGISGEIYISGDGVSKGYLNNEELTNKNFISNPFIPGTLMYKTGDLGMYSYDGEIICLGRSDNQVKIRGLRIELGEIEQKILEIDNIDSCVVVKKVDELSHEYLCAYYTSSLDVNLQKIHTHLYNSLPKNMVPQYFMRLPALPYTPNGKIDIKNLPLPKVNESNKKIILPRNEIDLKLIDLLKLLLNVNTISIADSFFELGGDSLSAINLCVQIQNEFNVQLFVKDILEHSTVQEISDIISKNLDTVNKVIINSIPKADYYPTSSSQKRMFFVSNIAGTSSTLYNLPGGIILEGNVDTNKLEMCFKKLIERHESLRTFFELQNNIVVQKVMDKMDFNLNIEENPDFKNLECLFNDFVKPFDLSKAPLFRAKFIKFEDNKSALFVDMHHIIADGTSLSIFIDELCKLYNDETLPELEITYKDFAAFESNLLSSNALEEAEKYWVNQFADDIPVLNMPTNYNRPAVQSFDGAKIYSSIDLETKQKIEILSKNLGITPYMLLLSTYYILLSKYTSQEDIVVGSPIVGRDISETYNLIGMFVNTLALRNKIDSNLSFKDFLETIKNNCLNAYKYQTYPFDELVNKLNIKRDTSRNPLFDTMFTYQNNGLKNINLKNINAKYYIPDTNISKFDLSLELIPNDKGIEISFEYATKLFDEDFIKNISNHYINILNVILENSDIKIADIDMLSEEERKKILFDFNNTSLDYPRDTTIVQLFEEQVEKAPDNIALVFEDQKLTYRELNEKANSVAHFLKHNDIGKNDIVPVFMNRSLELIITMLGIIKAGAAYLPITVETPAERLDFILQNSKAKIVFVKSSQNLIYNETIKLVDMEEFDYSKYSTKNINLEIKPLDLLYVIYTSGSTGNPKGVKVCHHNLVNFVKSFNEQYLSISCDDKLLASTNISFDVSIFEFFMTLLNGSKLYLYNEPNVNDIFKYCKTIIKEKITFLYIPPNILEDVYSILSTYSNIPINKMLLGVEPIKSSTIKKYYTLNPNMKIINAYGPTEATICVASVCLNNDILKQYKIIPIGRPLHNLQIYILDKNRQPVPVGVPGEIYISGDNVARGYLNNRELTDKNFVSLPQFNCKLAYKTGDLAKWNDDGLISFIGRNDTQVKVNGHRIELGEIESCLYLYPNIDKALVLLDKNNKLICYFSSSKQINVNDLKAFMQRKLPLYFIPNFFVQVEKFKLTANGKIDRKALANIKTDNPNLYEEPTTPYQKSLVEAFETVLGIDKVGINDNFFELGGDSLLAIKLSIRINNIFSREIPSSDIFIHPCVKSLADYLTSLDYSTSISIPTLETASYYLSSSAQKRMFYTSNIAGENSVLYNIPGGVILEGDIDVNKLEKCFNLLINRHESLRTYFELIEGNVVQKIIDNFDFKLAIENNCNYDDLHTIFEDFVKPFDLSKAPLFRAKFIKFEDNKSALFVDIHHIISDGTSLSIFIDELCKLYNGKELPKLNITYKDFSAFENQKLTSGDLKEAENYWANQFADDIPILNMPTNHPRPATQSFEGKKIYTSIDLETKNKIDSISKSLGVTPYMLLFSVYHILLEKYTSQEDIVIGSPVVGRDNAQTYNLIGMFVNTLALRNKIDSEQTFKEFLETVKTNCLNAYKYQTYPFDELINKLNIKRDISRNPLFDTMFTYQNNGLVDIKFNNINSKYYIPETSISKFDLSLELIPNDKGIEVSFEYATKLFDEDFIKNLSNHYINILNVILENFDIKIADINMLSEEEKSKILYDFNNTKMDYPKDKTIVQLFEEQVEKAPNNIALVFEDQKLTYRELNEKANSLAHYLKHNGIGKNDIVPVLMNRSIDLIISMYGIIKCGGAYLPISSEMPKERIDFIIQNSKAKLLITRASQNLIYENNIKIIDLEKFDYSKHSIKNLNTEIRASDLLYVIYTSGSTGNPKGVKLCHQNLSNFIASFSSLYGDISSKDKLLASTNISFDVSIFEFFITLLNGATLYLYDEPSINDIFKYCKYIMKNKITFLYIPPNILEDVYSILSTYSNIPINKMLLGVEPIKSSTIKKYYTLNPNMKIINAYGPTETTICATAVTLSKEVLKNYKTIPIGKPLHNLQIYILDKYMQPVPIGIPGEIYIAGDNVAKGYLNNKELTDKTFVNIPNLGCKLAYKTGDLAKWNNDGLISFIGRNDSQIKINGHRIELGEIESCIYQYPNIDKTLVLLDKNNKLICYFSSSKQINVNDLKAFMQRKLPTYFIPNFFIQVEKFKITANGKIDKKALTNIKTDNPNLYEEPTTPYQKSLVEAFETVLGINKVGINDNFFELGGDSLLAIKLQIEAFNKGLDLSYKDIFKYPSAKQLSENISSSKSTDFNDEYNYSEINELLKNNTFNKKDKLSKNKLKNILLTGSTGYLGSHILDVLMKNTKCNVYCLIRQKDNNDPQIRLLNTLRFYFGNKYDRQIFNRIIVVEGDIKNEKLGLNDLYYDELGNTIDCVINSAALVKHYGNMDSFNSTNIQGAKNIMHFCNEFNCKLFHLSTLSVSGNIFETDSYKVAELSNNITFNEQSLYIGQDLSNVYIYTKFIAERLILEQIIDGNLDAKIIRLGNITNRYSDGIFQINVTENAFLNRINSFLHIGCIPDYLSDKFTEFSPVDLCAEAIVKLIYSKNNYSIYHIYNNNHITFKELFTILKSLKVPMEIVDKETFNKKVKELSKNNSSKNVLSGIINDFDENKNLVYNTNIKIQNTFTNKLLKTLSFKWPKISEKYLRKYIIYLKSIGYIK